MEQSRNAGGGMVVAFEEPTIGRQSRSGSRSTYLDAGRAAARPLHQPQGAVSRRRTYADGELDVFSAERYFKGAMDGDLREKEDGVVAVVAPPPLETARSAAAVVKPAGTRASTASSAVSSNSRAVLLRGGRDRRDRMCCVHVGALMRTCSGKRSVRVDNGVPKEEVPGAAGEPAAASKIDWYKELRMQKAALGLLAPEDGSRISHGVVAAALAPSLSNLATAKVAAVGLGREVIREDKVAEFVTSASSRERRIVAPVRDNNNVPPGNEDNDDDDGAGSESSSDLFEIKSLMIDKCPYEPSEASIQWSVATADASERGDCVSARWIAGGNHHRGGGAGRGLPVTGRQNRDHRPSAGLLSGCVSHRAVEVSAAPNAPRRHGEGFQKARNGA